MSGIIGHRGLLFDSVPKTIDAFTTNLWGAFSLNRIITGATDAFVGINTTSLSTATIGFNSNGTLDLSALATLSGANSVAVSEFANQQGTAARKFGAGTAVLRPAIVTSGAFLGSIQFDGTSDGMVAGANSGTPTAFTVFLRGKLRSTGTSVMLELSVNYNAGKFAVTSYDSGALQIGIHSGGSAAAQYAVSLFSGKAPNDDVQMWRFDRSQVVGPLSTRLAINGALQTRTGNADAGAMDANFAAAAWYLGARGQASLFAPLNVHTLLIYEGAVSDADAASISAILAAL